VVPARAKHAIATAAAIVSIALTVVACSENPATGKRQLALISEEQEIQLGRESAGQIRNSLGLVKNDALQAYVQRIGESLAAQSERPELPWSFQVVDDPTPNAFALPGGFIFVTRGMLAYMDSEAELAAVLGHEIAHVTARHSVEQLSKAQLAQLGLGIGMILFPEAQRLGGLFNTGMELLFLKHSRDAERQADDLGFRYALTKRYDVREMDDIFATLQRIAQQGGRSPLPAWTATHPDPGERIKAVQARLKEVAPQLQDLRLGRADFLNRIDGLSWGDNPRNGYFQGNRFLHPDLGFRMEFPAGWRFQNLSHAVIASAPEQDAAVQLTLTEGSPREAAGRFATQPGLQTGRANMETINGLPEVTLSFASETEQGSVQGIAAFVSHQQRTYQVVGFAPATRFAEVEQLIAQSIGSFAPLTDPSAREVHPPVIDVVKLERPISIAELARADQSAVDLETLVAINQVSDARAPLPAGTLVKRVARR
jgi:predicted Zn-dependent protease